MKNNHTPLKKPVKMPVKSGEILLGKKPLPITVYIKVDHNNEEEYSQDKWVSYRTTKQNGKYVIQQDESGNNIDKEGNRRNEKGEIVWANVVSSGDNTSLLSK